jgi:hypothetical protein
MSITKQENKQSAKANKKTLNDEIIMDPNKEDILCGKEKHCVSHPGSINFRAMIDQYAYKYQEAITKNEKMAVTKEIYDLLGSQNSRFLKFSTEAGGWEQLSSLLARDKISHALRFANREKKAPSSAKPRTKKGHRRNGSDSSASTLSTAATELSAEDFECLLDGDDEEPLDWKTMDDEPKPYAYPIYENTPAPAAYTHHSYAQPYYPHPPAYAHGYYHPQSYHHNSYHLPQHHYAPYPVQQPQYHQYEEPRPESFPERPLPEPPVRDSSMDVDLSYLVSEPLMDWELEPEQVSMVNDQ